MSFSIILPTLNERGHIIDLINIIRNIFQKNKISFEIIVIDDNSNDGTGQIVDKYKKKKSFLKLHIRKNKKRNLALSINEGIKIARYNKIIWMDADFQHPPKYIKEFVTKSQSYDVIIASRFLKESGRYFNNDKFKKKINENQSYIFNKICKFLFFKDITDYTSGFICIKKKFLKNYNLNGFYGDYFLNLIIQLKKDKCKILEIPFIDAERASGKSKTVVKVNLKYLYTCLRYVITLLKVFFKNKFNFD
tara:strand:- start:3013 stop:3759 length:747 start_codon:yes stop_codon:yes gene_type:complete